MPRPTGRAFAFASGAFVFYLFANQTQVGWLYVVAALLAGVVGAAFWRNRAALRHIKAERLLTGQTDVYEGDVVTFRLRFSAQTGTAHIRVQEVCAIAPPDHPLHTVRVFIPTLPAGSALTFDYTVPADRRGLHVFAPLALESRLPFGLFTQRRRLPVPTRVLVLPEVRPLKRLRLLDDRLAPQLARPQAGVGYEVIGVRPYRPGDSPRHIHWRSVARTGSLMSKEFADEAQPGVTLALDLYAHRYAATTGKHTPFEWAVKAGASIGEYAARKGYPLALAADEAVLPTPGGNVTWTALLDYLARVMPTGQRRLADVLNGRPTHNIVALLLPYPDAQIIETVAALRRRQVDVLAILPDPASFPDALAVAAAPLASTLAAFGATVRVLTWGDDWAAQMIAETVYAASR